MILNPLIQGKQTIYSEYLNEEIIDLLGKTFQVPKEYTYEVVRVDPGYEARYDLISKEVFNDEINADIIRKLNGPSNPFEINEDMYIMIPTFDYIGNFRTIPSKLWDSDDKNGTKPKPKSKTSKRRPNDAVIGDKRFNIDSQSKIVIY